MVQFPFLNRNYGFGWIPYSWVLGPSGYGYWDSLAPMKIGPIPKVFGCSGESTGVPLGPFKELEGRLRVDRRYWDLVSTWTSKMAKIMDPILPILSILGYWAIIFGLFWRSR